MSEAERPERPESQPAASPGRPQIVQVRHPALEIAVDGLFAGVLGGITVAIFFLIVDGLQGRPLYTPSLLGSVLFLGQDASSFAGVSVPMTFAYTGVHMLAFVGVGMVASIMVTQFERNPSLGFVLVILFVCFEVGFFGLDRAFMPGVLGALHSWLVAVANLLSAGVMAIYLLWYSHPGALRNLQHVWDEA